MATNPYTYGGTGAYDQRWTAKQATTTTRLNYARSMADYLRWLLDQLMDTTAADFGTYTNPLKLGTLYMWHDATNDVLRITSGSAPTAEDDGVAVVTGGI